MNIGFIGLLGIFQCQYLESSNSSEPVILLTHVRVIFFWATWFALMSSLIFQKLGLTSSPLCRMRKSSFILSPLSFTVCIPVLGITTGNTSTLGWFGLYRILPLFLPAPLNHIISIPKEIDPNQVPHRPI